ncbi:MAG TPA: outer membrane protein assembly factor BamD [bacterium]|nr:outer membrane protein assembly factor BamD [bacterium]
MKLRVISMFLIFSIAALSGGCGKKGVSIGKGDPSEEFKECLRLSTKGNFEDSIQCFEMFKARYPQTPEGQEAELRIGDAQFKKKEYLLAAESYRAFLRLHPTHPKADYAHYRAGVSYFKESPKAIDRDQGYLDDAIGELRTVLRRYPSSAYADLSRATLRVALLRIAKRSYYIGNFYFKRGEYIAAIPRFREVAADFPDSGLADISLYKIVEAEIKLGRLDDAKIAFGDLSVKYPGSKYTKKAEAKLLRAAKKK